MLERLDISRSWFERFKGNEKDFSRRFITIDEKWLGGKEFSSNAEVISTANDYFSSSDKSYYSEGKKGLEKCFTKCIKLKKDNVEK